jgi:hypothetical protein
MIEALQERRRIHGNLDLFLRKPAVECTSCGETTTADYHEEPTIKISLHPEAGRGQSARVLMIEP